MGVRKNRTNTKPADGKSFVTARSADSLPIDMPAAQEGSAKRENRLAFSLLPIAAL
jgi:hypothetical protein